MKPTEAATECPPESEKTERMEEKQQEDKAAAPSTSVDESDVAAEASKLIGSGNKHMVLGDYPSAVNAFQEASSLLGKKYGETADECAESYFLYGKALLELARMENGVLGNALEGVDVEEEAESATAAENPQIESANDLDDEGCEGEDEENEEGTAEDKENEEEEEVGNLQLAWEMLDLAQVIYKRQSTKEAQLSASQAHLKLGEIGIESGNYSQAIGDFLECLKIQQKHLEAHDRLLAETHYQLGLAYNYHNQYDDAIAHFNKSAEVIEKRLAMLSERIEKGEGSEEEDKKEMEDLKELLPEIKEKIEDAKESKKSGPVAEQVLKETLTHGSSPGFPQENGSSSSSTPASTVPIRRASDGAASSKTATDISHLVRKKRKPEEVSPQKDSEAKKPKQEATVNGSGDAAAHNGNGVAETMGEEEKPPAAVESEKAVESTA